MTESLSPEPRLTRGDVRNYTQNMAFFVNYPSWITPYVVPFLPVRWYAVMYIVAFAVAYLLARHQVRNDSTISYSEDELEGIFFWSILGLLLGARIFSCLFYSDTVYYLTHPWMMFWPFENGKFVGLPGMSYHGGVVGAFAFGWIWAIRHRKSILEITDVIVAGIPLGYTFGRIGNFINGELYGRVTMSSWGMIFPQAERFSTTISWVRDVADRVGIPYVYGEYVNLPRYPSQLFEAFGEGLLLFLVLWFVIKPLKKRRHWANGTIFGSYIIGYGLTRFVIEYFRQPDADIGYVLQLGKVKSDNIALFSSVLDISKGQVFCFLMIVAGAVLIAFVNRKKARKETYDDRGKTGGSQKRARGKKS